MCVHSPHTVGMSMKNPSESENETNTTSKVFPEFEASDESVVLFMLQPRLKPLKSRGCAASEQALFWEASYQQLYKSPKTVLNMTFPEFLGKGKYTFINTGRIKFTGDIFPKPFAFLMKHITLLLDSTRTLEALVRARLILRDRKTKKQKDKEKSSALRFLMGKRAGKV